MLYIQTESRGHVPISALNRPQACNAFNRRLGCKMESIVDRFELAAKVRGAELFAESIVFRPEDERLARLKTLAETRPAVWRVH